MIKQMPYSEILDWVRYFRERPIGWREDHRASMIMAPHVKDFKPTKYFSSLNTIENERRLGEKTENDQFTLAPNEIKNNPFIQHLRAVSGGKFLSFLNKEEEKHAYQGKAQGSAFSEEFQREST